MKTKLTAIWNLIWSEYFVVISQKKKGKKCKEDKCWTKISAVLDAEEDKEMCDAIQEFLNPPVK